MAEGEVIYEVRSDDSKLPEDLDKSEKTVIIYKKY